MPIKAYRILCMQFLMSCMKAKIICYIIHKKINDDSGILDPHDYNLLLLCITILLMLVPLIIIFFLYSRIIKKLNTLSISCSLSSIPNTL